MIDVHQYNIKSSYKKAALTPIWNEGLFESHSRLLSLPVMYKLLIHMETSLRELLGLCDSADCSQMPVLLRNLQPLAAFLGYSALAEIGRCEVEDLTSADLNSDYATDVVTVTSEYVRNMIANLPVLAGHE